MEICDEPEQFAVNEVEKLTLLPGVSSCYVAMYNIEKGSTIMDCEKKPPYED